MTASELALEILQRNYDIETGELEKKIRQDERQAVIKEIEGWLDDQYPLIDRAELRAKLVEMKEAK